MSSRTPELPSSKFGVAISAGEYQNTVIETMTALCTGTKSDISYVYVEDTDLLRAAQLPFAVELSRSTSRVSRVSSQDFERRLRANATAAKQLVARKHHETESTWSFSIVRQRTANVVLDLTKTTGPTIFVASNSIPVAASLRGNTMRRNLHPAAKQGGIVVIVDQSRSSERAVAIAKKLAGAQRLPLHCLIVQSEPNAGDSLSAKWRQSGEIDSASLEILQQLQFGDVVKRIRERHPATVVVPISLVEGTAERIHQLGESVQYPILIVP
jgi:hypothetical protein